MSVPTIAAGRLRRLGIDREAAMLAGAGVLLPALLVLEPVQPVRALAAITLLMVLPGLALARLLQVPGLVLTALVTVSASLALVVLTSMAAMYAGVWSWQLCLVLLGAVTVALTLGGLLRRGAR